MENNTSFPVNKCLFMPEDFYTLMNVYDQAFRLSTYAILAIGSVLSVLIVMVNGLFLSTMVKTPNLISPPNILLCSLATADGLTGLLSIPLCIGWVFDIRLLHSCAYTKTTLLFMFIIFGASFFTIVGVCLERYLALFYSLRYAAMVTLKRVLLALLLAWIFPSLFNSLMIIMGDLYALLAVSLVNLFVGNTIIMFTYFRVFRLVRHHRKQIHAQQNQFCLVDSTARQRKHAITMGFVIGSMMCCYFPLCCFYAVLMIKGIHRGIAVPALYCMMAALSSSLWNPLIYCWRNRAIKMAVLEQLARLKGCFTGLQTQQVQALST
ncbi:G-protein coupled receptor 12-like [Exaiptasia diaphana]|uniref:G-protein coupled receptors family 1 profile domain-containing protein n=1 Tax=Exaiptasia diaphana TaxID=2652724 RepID=A0A913YD65_EXADI|nr:G-protein coupled receptor 12-like [Exaiptasia diaphana]